MVNRRALPEEGMPETPYSVNPVIDNASVDVLVESVASAEAFTAENKIAAIPIKKLSALI